MRPLSAVTAAIRQGACTADEIERHTGLSRSTVDAALEHLTAIGYLSHSHDHSACASCAMSGPGGCPSCGRGLTTLTLKAPAPRR